VRGIDHAAEISVRADLAPLLRARHQMRLDLEPFPLPGDLAAERLVLRGVMRSREAPDALPVACDGLASDMGIEEGEGVLTLLHHRKGALFAVKRRQIVETRLDARADL